MTGVQLAEAIQAEWPDLPVMLATGYAELERGRGADLLKLAKPFTQAELGSVRADVDFDMPTADQLANQQNQINDLNEEIKSLRWDIDDLVLRPGPARR